MGPLPQKKQRNSKDEASEDADLPETAECETCEMLYEEGLSYVPQLEGHRERHSQEMCIFMLLNYFHSFLIPLSKDLTASTRFEATGKILFSSSFFSIKFSSMFNVQSSMLADFEH